MRHFTVRGIFRAASVVLGILVIGNIVVGAIVLLAVPASLTRFVGYMLGSTSVFVSLLVAVWTPSVENTAKRISA